MPAPDRVLSLVHRAIVAVETTTGLSGKTLRLSNEATEVVVAGDLHGHVPNFQMVLQTVGLAANPHRHLVLQELIHSSFKYANGSEKSHQLVDLFCALKCQFPNRVHYLPGNHELAQMTNRPIGKGNDSYNVDFRLGTLTAYGETIGEQIYQGYMKLFRSLPIAIHTPNRVLLTHSLPNAKAMQTFEPKRLDVAVSTDVDLAPGGSVYAMVWGRDTSETNVNSYLTKMDADWLITGHIPLETGFAQANSKQLIVDCSASPSALAIIPATTAITMADLLASVVVW